MFTFKFATLSVITLVGINLNILTANAEDRRFVLCDTECSDARFYVGYNRTNLAVLGQTVSKLPDRKDRIFRNVVDLKKSNLLPAISEEKVDLENGNYVSSIHRIDDVRIGFVRKSELMNTTAKSEASTKASVKIVWGDTLKIRSRSLRKGTPVRVQIQRNIGGFGAPLTDFVYYKLKSQTVVNGKSIPKFDYTLEKSPGVGEKDKVAGQIKLIASIDAKVGDTIKFESLLSVEEGLIANSTPQTLNGADSTEYTIKMLTDGASLYSESGTFPN